MDQIIIEGAELSTVCDTVGELNFVEMVADKIGILGPKGLSIQPKSIYEWYSFPTL